MLKFHREQKKKAIELRIFQIQCLIGKVLSMLLFTSSLLVVHLMFSPKTYSWLYYGWFNSLTHPLFLPGPNKRVIRNRNLSELRLL